DYNLAPIGSGPYRFRDSERDSSGNILSFEMRAFSDYFEGAPYINKVTFNFYPDEASLLEAYNRKEVMGMRSVMPGSIATVNERKSSRIHEIAIPRIFSVFLNPTKSEALAYDEVREALTRATDRDAIIRGVLLEKAAPAYSALLPFMAGYADNLEYPTYDVARANALLDEKGWKRGDDGMRSKGAVPLQIDMVVPDWPELSQTAEILRTQWEQIGVRLNVEMLGASELQQSAIRPREYQALLFGQAAMLESYPYSFWHSSQKQDPGLNLAMMDNKDVDDILLSLREELDPEKRREKYREFQEVLLKENPAIFLYSPTYLYVVNSRIKGIEVDRAAAPMQRLSTIKDWYINTKRVKK
ncbi:MAG: ABC transporter substrate-binding protein, partial [Patescibacteria group bacterium]